MLVNFSKVSVVMSMAAVTLTHPDLSGTEGYFRKFTCYTRAEIDLSGQPADVAIQKKNKTTKNK